MDEKNVIVRQNHVKKNYKVLYQVGAGTYGVVYKA